MTGGRASAVFGATLCLPARSPASRSLAEGRRFGEGRAAPLSASLQKRNTLEAILAPPQARLPIRLKTRREGVRRRPDWSGRHPGLNAYGSRIGFFENPREKT